jgi:hypothetical protein
MQVIKKTEVVLTGLVNKKTGSQELMIYVRLDDIQG